MSVPADILDQPERLAKPLAGSVVFHTLVFAGVLFSSWVGAKTRDSWGTPNSVPGGSMTINVVSKIPLPSRSGKVNPLANDTESAVPEPPVKAKEEKRVQTPEPDAIAIKSRNALKQESQAAASKNRFREQQKYSANQVYSQTGSALASPMIGQTGAGGVGMGSGSPFGNRFGYYVDILRQKVAQNWKTADVDARLQTAPPVIVTFTILRDGSVRDVRVTQRSGNYVLDNSAQRAVYDASPFPPLPAGYERNEANIEFWFQLRR